MRPQHVVFFFAFLLEAIELKVKHLKWLAKQALLGVRVRAHRLARTLGTRLRLRSA